MSLRDFDPQIRLASTNVADVVEHCLTGNTSPRSSPSAGNFLAGTLDDRCPGGELHPRTGW
jgi:hypothetical protein